jgi:two-component sensor histidine kinase
MLTARDHLSCALQDTASLLLTELNHRFGNELTAALATLRMAQHGVGVADEASHVLDEAVARLENFSQVHLLLDRNRAHGPLRERLEALCRATAQSKGATRGVDVVFSGDDVAASEATAWAMCVVASELMTTAIRHACPGASPGVVGVSLRQEQECVFLTVDDNGIGLAPPDDRAALPGLGRGSMIINEIAGRVGGSISCESGPAGTAVTLTVPVERAAR